MRIGLIGAGMVGTRFIKKILPAGWPLAVFDVDPEKQAAAVALGAAPTVRQAACLTGAGSAREVAERSDVVLLSLPGSHAVEAAMEGPEGVLAAVAPRHLVIDTGTSRPSTAVEYAEKVRALGGRFIDGPLTGRAQGMIFLVGGDEEEFARARPVLELLGYKVAHCGPVGYGQRMKLVNQFVLAARLCVYAEGIHLARELDLDPEALVSVLEFGEARGPLDRQIAVPGGQLLALHTKDLEYLMEITGAEGIHAPLSDAVTRIFQETRSRSARDWAQTAVVTHWDDAAERQRA